MKWTFEQKLAWAKAYMAGEFVPIPAGFPERGYGLGFPFTGKQFSHDYLFPLIQAGLILDAEEMIQRMNQYMSTHLN